MFMKYTLGHAPLSTDASGSSRFSFSSTWRKKIHLFPILLQEITNKAVVFFLKTFLVHLFLLPFSYDLLHKNSVSLYYLECISLLRQTSYHHKMQAYRVSLKIRLAGGAFTLLVAGRCTALRAIAATCSRGRMGLWASGNGLKRCTASCRATSVGALEVWLWQSYQ